MFYARMGMGGNETLIYRLLKWYGIHGYRTILLTLEKTTDKSLIEDFNVLTHEYYVYNKKEKQFYSDASQVLYFSVDEHPLIVSFNVRHFMICNYLLTSFKYKCKFRYTIYIVHPYSVLPAGKIISLLAGEFIKILLRKKILVFMDEECVQYCISFYNLKKNKYKFVIFRLPMFINNNVTITTRNKIFNILSIGRFIFPFKGYILGLVNNYIDIYQYNNNISLTIIGYGPGDSQVFESVNAMPREIRNTISIIDSVPYCELNSYIKRCDVYVGIGTTVLDAANLDKITIVTPGYQVLNFAIGFFDENHAVLGEIYSPKKCYQNVTELITKIMSFTDEEYFEKSLKNKAVLNTYYNIDVIAGELFSHTKEYFNCDWSEFIYINILRLVSDIRFFLGRIRILRLLCGKA
jgi:hypothetical protein